ncbi:MAG: cache domain-containing protein, partial [Gammaproteobacteria bacterium]|nr:cache domain-containing protein [Gammaproteobacteria bacterium]
MNTALEVHGFRRERSGGRAILALVMVAVAAIVGISWLAQVRLAEHTRHDLAANLAHARDAAHTALRTWRAEEEQAVTVWANSPAVQRLTVELLAAPRTHEALLAAPAQARLRRLFEPLRAVRPYHGFFIIAPDGTSLASTRDANTGTPNLLLAQPVVLQRLLAGETVTSRPQRSDVPLADQSGELLSGRPTMFVGAPVRDANGEVIAACVFRLDPAQEFAALLRLGAPGVAGEALAFDAHGHVLGRVQDGGRFSLHTDAADRAATAALRLDPGPTGPGHLLTTAAATRSQAAEIDVQGYRGIHGAEVVGAWRWDDAMGIGIVSQITTQAAFGALRTATRTIQALTLLASLLVASLGAWFHAARRRLQAAHGRLVDVIEFTEEAVITFDVTRHINLANPAAHTMFGLPALVGNRVDDLIDDAVRGAYIDCLDNFVASQRGALARAELGTLRGRAKD